MTEQELNIVIDMVSLTAPSIQINTDNLKNVKEIRIHPRASNCNRSFGTTRFSR